MALCVVLEDFPVQPPSTPPGTGDTYSAGTVLDDAVLNVSALRAAGLAVLAFLPAMQDTLTRYARARRGIDIAPGLVAWLFEGGFFPEGSGFPVTTKVFADSPYAVSSADDVIRVNTTGGVVRLDLPALSATGPTKRYLVRKVSTDANKITLRPQATNAINAGVPGADFDLPDSDIGGVFMQWEVSFVGGTTWDVV